MSVVSSAPTTPVKTGIGHDNYRQLVCHEVDKIYSMRTHRNGSRSFLCGWRHTWVNERDMPMGSLELRDRFVMRMAPKSVTVNTMANTNTTHAVTPIKKKDKPSPNVKPSVVDSKKRRTAVAADVHGAASKRFKDNDDQQENNNSSFDDDHDDEQHSDGNDIIDVEEA